MRDVMLYLHERQTVLCGVLLREFAGEVAGMQIAHHCLRHGLKHLQQVSKRRAVIALHLVVLQVAQILGQDHAVPLLNTEAAL